MNRRAALTLGVLIVLAGLSYLLNHERDVPDTSADAPVSEGYYMVDAVLRTTDDSGVVRYRLSAGRIDQQPRERTIEMTALDLEYGNTNNLWRLRADRGLMPESGERIALRGDVTATLQSAASHGATQMSSPTLDIDIDGETATTDDPVVVRFDRGALEAVGLDVDLANETIRLRSDVEGVFEPPAP